LDNRFLKTEGVEAFTGNELILKGALEGGVNLFTGYPGSPVADVFDAAQKIAPYLKERGILAEIANNEALAAARLNGSQMADLRAVAVMKSVGFNVAADGLFTGTLAKTGHKGGAVIVVGDDPWNDSTQVPQDSRRLSDHLLIPSLEPSTYQEIKDFIPLALELSKRSDLYVSVILSTNLADGGALVHVNGHPESPITINNPGHIDSSKINTAHSILLPPYTSKLEKEAYEVKFPAVLKAALELGVNKLEYGDASHRLGFVAAGLPYCYLVDTLREAGLEGHFPILRLGMTFPIEPEIVKAFAKQVDEIIVIENKRSFIEAQIRDLLVRAKQHGQLETIPAVWGKDFPDGFQGVPAEYGMNPSVLLKRLGPFLDNRGLGTVELKKGLQRILEIEGYEIKIPARTATFCSGCPHRDSTSVFIELRADLNDPAYMLREHQSGPSDLLFHGDAGCYSMLFLPPNSKLMHNYSGMGLGAGTSAGIDPFVDNKNITFIGDGTFFHSGMSAVSDAVKNNADILFVILDNKTTAMTGHQPHPGVNEDIMGDSTFAQDLEQALLGITKGSELPVVRINPERREDYRAALEDLILMPGPKFIIADKECGITYHRRLRRDRAREEKAKGFLAVEERILVNEDACEFCLECTVKTGCPGLNFVETTHGPKITTDDTNCVSDGACARVKACPSFEKVTVRRKAAPPRPVFPSATGMPEPAKAPFTGLWRAYIAGIGGMGIGSVTATLVRAAQQEGYYVQFCDKKGIAIRNGGVYSHVTFSQKEQVISPVIPYGNANLLVGIDVLEAVRGLDPAYNLRVASPELTACVVNSHKNPTILTLMGQDGFSVDALEDMLRKYTKPGSYWSGDISRISQQWLGSTIYDNTLMLGVAFQRGVMPLSLKSMEEAFKISFSGTALEKNMQAFTLGRDLVLNPQAYGAEQAQSLQDYLREKVAFLGSQGGAFTSALDAVFAQVGLDDAGRRHLAQRFYELIHFEDFNFAKAYLDRVLSIGRKDSAERGYAATLAAIKGLYKAMAIKDEVWVAQLLTAPEKYARDAKKLGVDAARGDRVEYEHFNRPHFDLFGAKIEFDLKSRDWMLRLMRHGKFLRRLLPTWHAREKAFRDWYIKLSEGFDPSNYERWVELLSVTEEVRGYRDVRYPTMDAAMAKAKKILIRGATSILSTC
jgi:indolepyruvate ferredoxin oxidoreductase